MCTCLGWMSPCFVIHMLCLQGHEMFGFRAAGRGCRCEPCSFTDSCVMQNQ
jgi:hypothetical protein